LSGTLEELRDRSGLTDATLDEIYLYVARGKVT
jgi:ABC-2 type transport system ATP-binding protein